MSQFILHEAGNSERDMLFVNPSAPDSEAYAERFTEEVHRDGHPTEELIPLADAVIRLANSDN